MRSHGAYNLLNCNAEIKDISWTETINILLHTDNRTGYMLYSVGNDNQVHLSVNINANRRKYFRLEYFDPYVFSSDVTSGFLFPIHTLKLHCSYNETYFLS